MSTPPDKRGRGYASKRLLIDLFDLPDPDGIGARDFDEPIAQASR